MDPSEWPASTTRRGRPNRAREQAGQLVGPRGRVLEREPVFREARRRDGEPSLHQRVPDDREVVLPRRHRHGQCRVDDAVRLDDEIAVPGGGKIERVERAWTGLSTHVLLRDRGFCKAEKRNCDRGANAERSHER